MAIAPAASGAHTEAPGGHKGPFPPFNRETFGSQLLWFAITFALLYFLLARVALPRVARIIEARRARIRDDLAAAARLKGESEAALATYEKSLAAARGRAQAIAADTHRKLAAETEARRKELEAALAAKLAEAEGKIDAVKGAAMREVRGIALETAGAIVERLIGAAPARPALERAVDQALH
jgi:F-type H+-transporting ATPase subunit b